MLNHKLSRSSEGQGHNDACLSKGPDLSNNVCEYEVNRLTTENWLEENETVTQIVYNAGRPTGQTYQSISQNLLLKIRLRIQDIHLWSCN